MDNTGLDVRNRVKRMIVRDYGVKGCQRALGSAQPPFGVRGTYLQKAPIGIPPVRAMHLTQG